MSGTETPLGRYRLLAELGRGGMADVYLASMNGPGGFQKLLVVKLARLSEDPMIGEMFLDEAKLAARLSHPNIVQTFEVGSENGRHFIVMEYLDGPTLYRLRRLSAPHGGIPLRMMVQILSHVLDGLEYAHTLKEYDGEPLRIVHRDLSPQNILVTVQGSCKVLDFGIAKAADSRTVTQAGFYRGKLHYMAPEQARGEHVDFRADLFCVGTMLAEAMTNRPYWGDATGPVISGRLVNNDVPLVTNSGADPRLEEICNQALAAKRDERPTSAAELKVLLDWYLDVTGGPVSRETIADFVKPLFEAERARIKTILDEQFRLGSIGTGIQARLELPSLDQATPNERLRAYASLSSPNGKSPSTPSGFYRPSSRSPLPMPIDGHPVEIEFTGAAVSPPVAPPRASVPPLTDIAFVSHPEERRSHTPLIIGATLVLLALIGLAALIVVRKSGAEPSMPAAAPTAAVPTPRAAPPAPTPAAEPEPVVVAPTAPAASTVALSATPIQAKLVLDGQPLNQNPYSGSHPRDERMHTLVVEAEGYQAVTTDLSFAQDVQLHLELRKVEVNAPPESAPPRRVVERRRAADPEMAKASPTSAEEGDEIKELKPSAPAVPPKSDRRAIDTDAFETEKKRALDHENPWKE